MALRDYERILASLRIKLNQALYAKVIKPVTIRDYKSIDNKLIFVNKGEISYEEGDKTITVKEGEMFFLPELSSMSITYGKDNPTATDNNQFTNYQEQYFDLLNNPSSLSSNSEFFSYVSFNAKVYEAIDFMKFINIPPFKIENNAKMHTIFQNIMGEIHSDRLGKQEILENSTKCLVIELIRHIIENNLFIDQLVLKSAALIDLRLATLFKYIANNIPNDLSNHILAHEVGLSKDYVGQWFKNITGMNLQPYIETIRLNQAIKLLKNPSIKIKNIAIACGFSDQAYFCRKFKTLWGTNARKMRMRTNQVSHS